MGFSCNIDSNIVKLFSQQSDAMEASAEGLWKLK